MRTGLFLLSILACSACDPLPSQVDGVEVDGGNGIATEDGGRDAGTADAGLNSTPDAGTADAGAGAPALPTVTSATVLSHGSIRVQWTNPNPACDTLALMRSRDGAAAVVASQPASSATEVVDAPGHASGTYCYSLACSRGGAPQGSSNQKCATQ